MQGGLDKEAKVGAMLRHMSGDVAIAFKKRLDEWYTGENGELDKVGECCAKWHWTVVKYAPDPLKMRGYVSIIQHAFDNKILLDEIPAWKRLMRIILPEEFLAKMSGFTQVPQIAVMDEQHLVERGEAVSVDDVQW